MRIIACLPKWRKYEHEYSAYAEMGNFGHDVDIVLLHGPHPLADKYPRIRQVTVPEGTRFGRSRSVFFQQSLQVPRRNGRVLVIDTFIAQVGLSIHHHGFLGTVRFPNVRNILMCVSPNPGYILQGHWLGAKHIRPALTEVLSEFRLHLPRIAAEWWSTRYVDGFAANAPNILEDARRYYGVPEERTCLIPNTHDPDFFSPGNSRRKDLCLRGEDYVVLYAGNLTRRKGADVAIAAIKLLRPKIPNIRLVLLGGNPHNATSGWLASFLRDPEVSDFVEYRGVVNMETLRDYYRSVDLLLLPTRHEGSPRVVKEALECGCPVVGSPITGIRCMDPGGLSIVCSTENTPESHAREILRFIHDFDYRQERIGAIPKVLGYISRRNTAERYVEFADRLFAMD